MRAMKITRKLRILTSKLIQYRGQQSCANPENMEQDSVSNPDEFSLDPNWRKWWKGSAGNHPGKCRISAVQLPKNFQESTMQLFSDYYRIQNREKVFAIGHKLCNVLAYRPLQINSGEAVRVPPPKNRIDRNDLFEFNHPEAKMEKKKERQLWKQIVYDKLNSVAYLLGRSAGVYASTLRVLSEIKKRDPDFHPETMLDYGSGTGTAVWAANSIWGSTMQDFYCVDWSQHMNQISQFLLTGGKENAELTGIYIRPFLPISFKHTYDIVIAAYTLSELPSEKERLATLKILWEKTDKYLVIIEQGFQQGYHMIMEARNLIAHGIEGANITKARRTNSSIKLGHIFAPCPHKMKCPKWKTNSPCSFKQTYHPPAYARKFLGTSGAIEETFTYIILAKEETGLVDWPRAISDPQSRAGKVHCHLCMANGQIEHLYMKKETHGKDIRHIAKKTVGGDLLPYKPVKPK